MKKIDSKGKSSVRYIGKGFIIVSIVTTSSLGFLLGFFVGKNASPPALDPTPVVAPVPAQNTDPSKGEAVSVSQETAEVQPGVQQREVTASHPDKENRPFDGTLPAKAPEQVRGKVPAGRETGVAKTYAVQAGAFRNASEANALKSKLNKKGYRASVLLSETVKHEKVYKVIVGRFSKKKEADLFAVRIGKNEGLRTFVTVRNQEEVRSH